MTPRSPCGHCGDPHHTSTSLSLSALADTYSAFQRMHTLHDILVLNCWKSHRRDTRKRSRPFNAEQNRLVLRVGFEPTAWKSKMTLISFPLLPLSYQRRLCTLKGASSGQVISGFNLALGTEVSLVPQW